jgi:rhamnosyltransferase
MAPLRISIIIVTRNEAKNIDRCLDGVCRQQGEWEKEVVLVDSSSEDGTPERARQYGAKVHVIPRHEFHHSITRNLGATLSAGDYLVYLGGDAWPAHEHWLERLMAPLSESERIAACYGRHLPKPECDPINRFRLSWNYGPDRLDKCLARASDLGHRLCFFSTVNCVIRRRVWDQFRFPEDVSIFEDATFARKVINAGFTTCYIPEAEVVHSHNLRAMQIFHRYRDVGYIYSQYAIANRREKSYGSEGVSYLKAGFQQIRTEAGLGWAGRFIIHTAFGYFGLVWGRLLWRWDGWTNAVPNKDWRIKGDSVHPR